MKTILLLRRLALIALAALSLNFTAHAHDVWIENTETGRLVLRFGEPGEDVEMSPGHLDSLTPVTAWSVTATNTLAPLETRMESEGVLLVGAKSDQSVQAETGFPVMASANKPGRKPFFYARWQPVGGGEGKPALMLDIVPTGRPGQMRVFFKGQPVPEAKLTAHLPGGETEKLTADAEGVAELKTDKPGLYLVTVNHHRETQPGFHGGSAYELVSHNAALAWRQP
jgi:uncharacterized GH25 family protein